MSPSVPSDRAAEPVHGHLRRGVVLAAGHAVGADLARIVWRRGQRQVQDSSLLTGHDRQNLACFGIDDGGSLDYW
jgi:hypothetical protein